MYYITVFYKDGWTLDGEKEKTFEYKELGPWQDHKALLNYMGDTFAAWED